MGSGAPTAWGRAGRPRESRAQRLDPCRCGAPRGERLLVAGDRPAVGGGRHGVVRRRVRSHGGARGGSSVAIRRRHEGGCHRASPPASEEEGCGHRLLFRRWDGVASARVEGASLGGRRSLLWPLSREREPPGSKAAVLGIYAELDSRVNASPVRRRARRFARPACGTRSSRSPTSITPSSTPPARGTTAQPLRPHIAGCSTGSARTSHPEVIRTANPGHPETVRLVTVPSSFQ